MPTQSIRNARAASLPAKLSRSWLLVNAMNTDTFTTCMQSEADSVIFDLESSVAEADKAEARANVVAAFAKEMPAWVRINGMESEHWKHDLQAIQGSPQLRGVILPNSEKPEQVTFTAMKAGAGVPVLALIETAVGMDNASRIAKAPGTFRLALGTNDFRKDTGVADDPIALAYARSQLVIASRVGGLAAAIDGPSGAGASLSTVQQDCSWTLKMGMAGKLLLNPEQAQTINESLAPTEEDRTWARELLAEAESGHSITDGSYLPRLARAKKIAFLADSYGLWNA